jgi:anti-sigma factor ChrR (cupin superfamily)
MLVRNSFMQINHDFTRRVQLNSAEMPWIASPAGGVERRMLERVGAESGHATSLVRYAPGARFPAHLHPGGEEILVLSGVFSDDFGDYGAGSYLRNPPGSRHAPYSKQGCEMLVKLQQFASADLASVRIDTANGKWMPGVVPGLTVQSLHAFGAEHTALVRWAAGTVFNRHRHWQGEEIFVISGTFQDDYGSYPAGSWLRSPHLSEHTPFSTQGCLIYVKTGHLPAQATGCDSN